MKTISCTCNHKGVLRGPKSNLLSKTLTDDGDGDGEFSLGAMIPSTRGNKRLAN